MGRNGQIGGTFPANFLRLALLLQNGIVEELQIHIVAHAHHVARLFGAQQVACPANFQVAHGDFKAGAKFHIFADGAQALVGRFAEDFAGTVGQIGVGAAAGPPDASANLVKL